MLATAPTGFLYLNAANQWPSFILDGLVIETNGSLHLAKAATGFVPTGLLMGGPFEALDGDTPWYRFGFLADALPPGTHLQVFTWTANSGTPPFLPASSIPFPGWQPSPRDSFEGVIFNPPARRLWLGAVIRSDGINTPSIHQIRNDYGRDTYAQFLPAIYREDPSSRDLLQRFLSLSETALGPLRNEIVHLTRLFDPAAAPDRGFPSWFTWLNGWLAWIFDHNWPEEEARRFLAGAFDLYAHRGTVEGLRRYLNIYAGVNAFIYEPGLNTTVWSLGSNSSLGFSTMLAPGDAAGAMLNSTSVLDGSNLAGTSDPFGAALFDDVAYRFCVEVNAGELNRPGALAALRAVIDREKPAHTVCELCIIPPRMRVGSQCRIGIDTVVGTEREAQLGSRLGQSVLAASAPGCNEKEVAHAN
jgi:phage tail-like protein